MLIVKKSLKAFLIAAVIALLIILPFYIKNAQVVDAQKYQFTVVDGVYYKQIAYHDKMNQFFNSKIKELIDGTGSLEIPYNDNCDNNISTFCVAKGSSDIFFAYREELLNERGTLTDELKDTEFRDFDQAITIERHSQKVHGIDRELVEAEQALDLTIKAYNELQIAWPLHVQYREIITNLEVYRTHLEGFEGMIKLWPKLFPNASTTHCT